MGRSRTADRGRAARHPAGGGRRRSEDATASPPRPARGRRLSPTTAGVKPIDAKSSAGLEQRVCRAACRRRRAGSAPGPGARKRARGTLPNWRQRSTAARTGRRPRCTVGRLRRAGRGRRGARARRVASGARLRRRAGWRDRAGRGRARCARARARRRSTYGSVWMSGTCASSSSSTPACCRCPWASSSRAAAVNTVAWCWGWAALTGSREQLPGGRGVLVRAALGEQAQLHGARLERRTASPAASSRSASGTASASACSARPSSARNVVLMLAIPSANSVMPRRRQKSIPSRQASSAARGPSYCQLSSARLLWRTAAARDPDRVRARAPAPGACPRVLADLPARRGPCRACRAPGPARAARAVRPARAPAGRAQSTLPQALPTTCTARQLPVGGDELGAGRLRLEQRQSLTDRLRCARVG